MRDRERVLHAIDEHVGPARMTLEGEGEDHTAWRVESDTGTWIARLPKRGRPSGPSATRREVVVMDLVGRMLGRWVPEAFVLDDATGLMLYRRVSGTPLQARLAAGTVSATHVEVIGAHLGRFVRDIAGLDANAVDGVIVDDTSLGAWRDECVDLLPAVSPHLGPTNVARIESFVAAEPPGEVDPATLVLAHNDLGAEHVIVDDDGQITGIIDWSDTAVANPAAELGRCLRDLGDAACAPGARRVSGDLHARRSDVEARRRGRARGADARIPGGCEGTGMMGCVTVIKINAITVPEGSGDELGRRFAARAGAVDDQDGFEGFELLKPTDERTTWLVITRWRDEESFQAWVNSPAFGHGHAGADRPAPHGGPVSVSSELWSYEVSTTSPGHG